MTIFDFLTMLGSLSLFLFGMSVMGTALEKRAGGSLKAILAKLTSGRFSGLLTGLAVTAVIQSSSATTVMVVGFVNSGLLSLRQSIPVIMGANIGTTVTAWLLSLSGISGDSLFLQLLKPSSFTPVLAVIGIILYLTGKGKKKDTGLILLGFATLMFGMESLSGSVSGLRNDPNFTKFFLMFSNPILGVLAGAILTGIVQSSSASVGILQALSSTGAVSYGAAIPIIMGQNIGTCVTAMLSSVGTNKNAHRAAVVHLSFNIIGTVVWLALFEAANAIFRFAFVSTAIDTFHIALIHSIFNLLCTLMLLPCCGLLEKLSYRLIPETDHPDTAAVLDSLRRAGLSLIVDCDDFNCDEALLQTAYNLPVGTVKVLSGKEHKALEPAVAWLPESEGSMLHLGSFASFVGGLEAAAGAAEGEHRSSMVLSASVLISCILAMIMALAGGLAGLPLPALALYQVAWAVLAMIFPLIQRY